MKPVHRIDPTAIAPAAGAVDVWCIPLREDAPAAKGLWEVLSGPERERARRYRRDLHRDRYVRTHAALRSILGCALGVAPGALAFGAGPHGKPHLERPGLEFNLSGTAGLALLAVTHVGPVGVDVERLRLDASLLEVAGRFFSPYEVRALEACPSDRRLPAFHRIWTRKEAYIKALGTGLALDLDSFDVSLEPGPDARLVATRPDPAEARRWRLIDLDLGPRWGEHPAALVVPAGDVRVRLREWCPDRGVETTAGEPCADLPLGETGS